MKFTMAELEDLARVAVPPVCTGCGKNRVKADVILFGEALPEGIIEKSIEAVGEADLLIIIGSSLQVAPANMLPRLAKSTGSKILLLNMSETPIDEMADVIVRTPVAVCLPRILELVKRSSNL